MNFWTKPIIAGALMVAPLLSVATPAEAGVGDLLVAPTRLVLDGRRGAEIIRVEERMRQGGVRDLPQRGRVPPHALNGRPRLRGPANRG